MSFKFVKVVAVPAVLGIASIRVYAVNETNTEGLLSPRELSIYSTLHQGHHYMEKEPGVLQRGLGKVRGSLQSYVKNIKGAFVSVKVMAVNLYHGGEDIYHFLKDPPSGFAPRVAVITVSGLAGVILARKGSRLKRLILPLSLTMAGFAMCYPIQTIAILKVGGKNIYAASQWTSETVASLWRSDTTVVVVPANLELAQFPETLAKGSGTQTVLIPEPSDAERAEESFREVHPPTEPRMSEAVAAVAPLSAHVLACTSGTAPTTPPADDDILLMTAEGKATCPSSSLTTKSQPVLPSLQSSGDITNATVVPGKPGCGADPRVMDFGQSNPEDADLYSTRS
ncbi:MICOS complex subunit MIC27 [Electrophorus electricus]|uniref:MICOS complex subunit MIC27 n=1 Tax=Electrophorus electricus TaxID=8005 RepID=UPI0015D07D30|nr:MICOS complex subunit MIC27 [Electrophorus electricus]